MEAVLAEGRFVRDRIKSRRYPLLGGLFGVTVFSIGLGIALFTTFTGFFSILNAASSNIDDEIIRGDISVVARRHDPKPIPEEDRRLIAEIPGVDSVSGLFELPCYMVLPDKYCAEIKGMVPDNIAEETQRITGKEGPVAQLSLLGLEDETVKTLRSRILYGWHDPDELKEMRGVYVPDGLMDIEEKPSVMINGRNVTFTAAGIADSLPAGNINNATIAAPFSFVRELAGNTGYTGLEFQAASDTDTQDIVLAIEALIGNNNDIMVIHLTSRREARTSVTKQFSILLYGLVAVVSLIGALNIINTITTNLILRTREFGTLRAVGMSGKQMRLMIRIEAFLYGFWALLGGGTVGVLLYRLMYSSVMEHQAIPWEFPWLNLLVSGLAAVLLGLFSSAVPMERITRMNIVESIRAVE